MKKNERISEGFAIKSNINTMPKSKRPTVKSHNVIESDISDVKTSKAILDIIAERKRQIESEGFSIENDDAYLNGELSGAAACYANYGNDYILPTRISKTNPAIKHAMEQELNSKDHKTFMEALELSNKDNAYWKVPKFWPWAVEWWKPKSKRENLIRAAALIIADIERLDRAENKSQ